jgi:hypothetical protein
LPPASSPSQRWRCAGFIKPATPLILQTAKCPEPLCPTSVLPPLGRRNFHLLRGRYPPVLAPTGSCATPLGLSPPSAFSLVWRVLAGCTQPLLPPRELPDVISENLSLDAGSRTTAVPPSALTCFFPDVIGLPPAKVGSASRFDPRITTSRGSVFSRAADIS